MPQIWQVCQDRDTSELPYIALYSVIFSPWLRLMWKLILFCDSSSTCAHIISYHTYIESIHNSSIDIFMHLFGSFG